MPCIHEKRRDNLFIHKQQYDFKNIITTYQIPVSNRINNHKKSEMRKTIKKWRNVVQHIIIMFYKEGLDFRDMNSLKAKKIAKELCYTTKKRLSKRHNRYHKIKDHFDNPIAFWMNRNIPISSFTKYNCKVIEHLPHSHYYDTAITEAISKWSNFLTWKEKCAKRGKPIGKKYPSLKNYNSVTLDSEMFNLDLENGWITINSKSIKNGLNIPITIPNKKRYSILDSNKITSVKIVMDINNKFTIHLCQKMNKLSKGTQKLDGSDKERDVLVSSTDLGERCLAVQTFLKLTSDSTGHQEVGRWVKYHDVNRSKESSYIEGHIRRKLQKSGKSNRIPNRKWHTQNITRNNVYKVANDMLKPIEQAIDKGYISYFFIGDLHAPVPPKKKALSRRLNEYPRAILRDILIHRLKKLGVKPPYLVSEYNSNKICYRCGSENTFRRRGLFVCRECGLKCNADMQASWRHMGSGVRRRENVPKNLLTWINENIPQKSCQATECAGGTTPKSLSQTRRKRSAVIVP